MAEIADPTLRIHDSVRVRWSVVDRDRRVALRATRTGSTDGFTALIAGPRRRARPGRADLEIELTLRESDPSLPDGMSVDRFIVAYWQLRGTAPTPPRLRCELLVDHENWSSGPGSGEHLDAIEATGPDFAAAIGTPDSEWLKHQTAAGDLPAHWHRALPTIGDTSLTNPIIYLPAGLEHALPPLRNDIAVVAVAVAIKRTTDINDASVWFAVDIAGSTIERPPRADAQDVAGPTGPEL